MAPLSPQKGEGREETVGLTPGGKGRWTGNR
jgi:hypothetical protein